MPGPQHFGHLHGQVAWQAQRFRRVVLRVFCLGGAAIACGTSFFVARAVFGTLLQLPFSALARLCEIRYYLSLSRHSTWQAQHLVMFLPGSAFHSHYSPSAGEESESLRSRVPQILIFKCRKIYTTTGRGSLKFLRHS